MKTEALKFEIQLTEEQIIKVSSMNKTTDKYGFLQFIEEVIKDFSKKNEESISLEQKILGYMQNLDESEHGAPDIYNYSLEDLNADTNALLGNFKLKYTLYYYFGCDDMNSEKEYYLEFEFNIDLASSVITFRSINNFTSFGVD